MMSGVVDNTRMMGRRPLIVADEYAAQSEALAVHNTAAHIIERDDYDHEEGPRRRLIRPVAVKVSTIAGAELYNLAYEKQITAAHIHQGVVDAHAWNEKWHPMADLDRASGAKNPSPEEDEEEEDSIAMLLEERRQNNKRKNENNELQQPVVVVPHTAPRPHLVRPIALRIQRPSALVPATIFHHSSSRHDNGRDGTLSPLSLPSLSTAESEAESEFNSTGEEQAHQQQQTDHQVQAQVVNKPTPSSIHLIPSKHNTKASRKRASFQNSLIRQPSPSTGIQVAVQEARDGLLQALAGMGGETIGNVKLTKHLDFLKHHYEATKGPSGKEVEASRGTWLTLTKPTFFGSLGENDEGDPMYTLGRMSFDMFSPTNLVCSLQGCFNQVVSVEDRTHDEHLVVPKNLKDEVDNGTTSLHTYHIVTAFTIEPNLPEQSTPNKDVHRPIKGIMTTYGYTLPDPTDDSRQSVWITGGKIGPNDDPIDQAAWKTLFTEHPPHKSFGEQAKFLAVKLLMGATMAGHMEDNGSMGYTFTRPIGGHGMAYVDTLYLDESLRIVQGHRGTIFVFSKLLE